MSRPLNRQISLKPQDLIVLLKLAVRGKPFTYAALGEELFMSSSEVHGSVGRAKLAGVLSETDDYGIQVLRPALREFTLHGARYAFPPILGSLARGIPTAHGAPLLRDQFTSSEEPVPVWPYSKGNVRGIAIQPLFPTVPKAVETDDRLYELLALFDSIRMGTARERAIASTLVTRILS